MTEYPITDDHIHIDPVNGRGIEAAKEFARSGGTHLFLVSKPAGSFGILPAKGTDFGQVFEGTLEVARVVHEAAGVEVFPVLGVHPAEINRLADARGLPGAVTIMKAGLDLAARYVEEGRAVALKSGRPHYEVPPDVWAASQEVLAHALGLGGRLGCAVQIHAESGPCSDVAEMATRAGIDPGRVVKHYAGPGTPLVPSVIAKPEAVAGMLAAGAAFTMESDYMDELSRPGAVTGPRAVPRVTRKMLESGSLTEDDIFRIHSETPARVYGVEISL